ncbi:U32 family peptidase [Roseburia sp. AM51-8]|uniref:peptidase U32 family protein n=1 Tax=Roseburia sp. AM51-8 TaxID=2292366 RepID=UPI000E4FAD49|nr:U32 family peptidase [Roseburia sp. AM51-8]RHQ02449.1 U32 family peptidase [Roseburia sp. AM51-8]
MRAKELELLSPAGNIEIFKSAIDAGADAVYFGGDLFGARAYAKNFSIEEGTEAIRYAHLYGRQAYLTVNTLLKNLEIERDLYKYIRAYYEAGLDAVIVQDMGVFAMLRSYFPDLALHASTQMTLAGADGAALLQKQGASRIVTSRELSIAEIAEIYQKTGIEIETFIHGALCVCYSGQCLMSSMLGGRSGNRGRCAQPCRLPYDLLDEHGKKSSMPGQYLLSPKDLCGIDYIKALAEAGVYSFKIEGRMKQKEYATGVVSLYRRYMDAYLEGRDLPVSKADRQRIFDLGNRKGFTHAYFTRQNDPDMITYTKPSHEKADLAATEPVAEKLGVSGRCYLQIGCPARLCVSYQDGKRAASVEVFGDVVETAGKTPITEEQVEVKLKKNGKHTFYFFRSGDHIGIGRLSSDGAYQ